MPSTTIKPVSVYLSAEQQEQMKKIAEELGVTPHALRKYAIEKLLKDWEKGWRPKRGRKIIKTLEP